MKRVRMLLAVATILATMNVASVLACTTFTPGYWKNHEWPVNDITIGSDPYWVVTETETLDKDGWLWTPPKRGNAWIILAQKVIAAKLSIIASGIPGEWSVPGNFPGTPTMTELVDSADDWLADHPSEECLPGHPDRAEGLELAAMIDYYLNWYDGGNPNAPPPYTG